MYVSWVLLNLVHKVFVTVSFASAYNGNDHTFAGWDNSNWSMLCLCVVFSLGVTSLASYKDIFFVIVQAYGFLGIFIEQRYGYACNHQFKDQCSDKIGVTAISFCGVLVVFVIVSALKHWKKIFYKHRTEI